MSSRSRSRAALTRSISTLSESTGESLGIEFEDVVFDGVMECANACAFCFVAQLPPGLRPALSVRDDDYRLSFLFGNFVTLTNLAERDMDRILEQRLSPLYISLHAVDPDVRARLVCPTVEDSTLDRIDTLLAGGIEVHIQVVLVPGVNDGEVLRETLDWLSARDGVLSVGIVPLGFTSFQSRFDRSFTPAESATVIDSIAPLQVTMRASTGANWVYLADEFYLSAGRELPADAEYDDYPQYENGIGLVRSFIDDFADATEDLVPTAGAFVAVTGTLFAPVLGRIIADAGSRGGRARVAGREPSLWRERVGHRAPRRKRHRRRRSGRRMCGNLSPARCRGKLRRSVAG